MQVFSSVSYMTCIHWCYCGGVYDQLAIASKQVDQVDTISIFRQNSFDLVSCTDLWLVSNIDLVQITALIMGVVLSSDLYITVRRWLLNDPAVVHHTDSQLPIIQTFVLFCFTSDLYAVVVHIHCKLDKLYFSLFWMFFILRSK